MGCKRAKTGAERNGQRGQSRRRTFCGVGRLRTFASSPLRSVTTPKRGEAGCKRTKTGAERNDQRGQSPRRAFCAVGRLRTFASSPLCSVTTPCIKPCHGALSAVPGAVCENRADFSQRTPFTFNLQTGLLTISGGGGTVSLALEYVEC